MIVYLVSSGSYSDWSIDSLWSTKEKAEERIKIVKANSYWRALEGTKKYINEFAGGTTPAYYQAKLERLEKMNPIDYDGGEINEEIDEFELDNEEDLKILQPLTKG
jgi:hypothetical protein